MNVLQLQSDVCDLREAAAASFRFSAVMKRNAAFQDREEEERRGIASTPAHYHLVRGEKGFLDVEQSDPRLCVRHQSFNGK